MIWYLLILAAATGAAYFSDRCRGDTVKRRLFWVLSFSSLFSFLAIRWYVGKDYPIYVKLFNQITGREPATDPVTWEPGFVWINRLVGWISGDYQWLFVLTGFLFLLFTYLAIDHSSADRTMSIYLLFTMAYYFYAIDQVRQFVCIGIGLYCLRYIGRKDWGSFGVYLVLASAGSFFFHKTFLVFIPLYFLLNVRYRWWAYAGTAAALGLVGLFHQPILDLILATVYPQYAGSAYLIFTFSPFNIALGAAMAAMSLIYYKPLLRRNPRNIILINLAVLTLFGYLFCGWIPELSRLMRYVQVFYILLIPEIIACEERKTLAILYRVGVYAVFFGLFSWDTMYRYGYENQYLPIRTIFDR